MKASDVLNSPHKIGVAGWRLFLVHNKHTKDTYPLNMNSKQAAKAIRDELNGGLSAEPDKHWNKDVGWRVALGPDHRRYKS